MAYLFYKHIQSKSISPIIGYVLLFLCVLGVFVIDEIKIEENLRNSLFYLLVLCSLPFLFITFKNNPIDRYIGELSFSLYISHHIVVSLLRAYFFSNTQYITFYGYTVVLCSLILAFLLQTTVVKAIEKYRLKRFS